MEIVSVEKIKKGDVVIIPDFEDNTFRVVSVEKNLNDGTLLIMGFDYHPEDPEQIVRIGTKKEHPTLLISSNSIALGLNEFWQKQFSAK